MRLLTLLLFVGALGLSSCVKESDDPSSIYDILYVSRDGADMPAHIHGNAASNTFILLLHGGPGGSGLGYRVGNYHRDLEDRYAVVYFDQRSSGASQGPSSKESITVDNMVDDVMLLVDVLKHKYGTDINLFLMGHSWGGTLGTAIMNSKERQQEFDGWLEIDGAHDFQLMLESQESLFPTIGALQIQEEQSVEFWTDAIDKVDNIDFSDIKDDDILTLNRLSFEAESNLQMGDGLISLPELEGQDLVRLIEGSFTKNNPFLSTAASAHVNSTLFNKGLWRRDYSSNIANIEIPTFIGWGRYDFVVPATLAEQAMELLPSEEKRLVIFENSGHSPMVTEPNAFVNEVVDFIEEYR